MDALVVQKLWMAGVVGAMLVFGIAALIGYMRQKKQAETESNSIHQNQ